MKCQLFEINGLSIDNVNFIDVMNHTYNNNANGFEIGDTN